MRNVFNYYDENDYLAHYGILGQKWGIRRFQNSDGSLTAEGKLRYGKALSEDVKKADLIGNSNETIAGVHRALDKNAAVKQFEKTNETRKELRKARLDVADMNNRINLQVNKDLEKEFGKPFMDLSGDEQIVYFLRGKEMFKERMTKEGYDELISKYKKLSQDYEKESIEFLKDLLGEYGDEPLKSDWAIKYNFVTKEMSKQTVQDLAALEMLRRGGGII